MEERVLDEQYLQMFVNKDSGYVKLIWNGYVADEKFRESLELALKSIQDNALTVWIGDLREMRIIRPEDQEWTNTVWFPRLFNTTLKRMALVNSRSLFNKIAVENIFTRANNSVPFDTQYFDDFDKAMEWGIKG